MSLSETVPINSFQSYNQTWNICCGFSEVWYNFVLVLLKIQPYFSLFYIYLILFSYSCTFHVAAYLKTCHLTAFWGMHSYISTIQGIWYRESWAIQRHTACALSSSQKNGQIDPDIEFEEHMQGHDWSRKTGLTLLSLESESCPKFQYLLPSQDFSSLIPSSFF